MPPRTVATSMTLLKTRLKEAGAGLHGVKGPKALARLLKKQPGPLWLEDHPWLRQATRELENLKVVPQFAGTTWAPEAHTAVTVGLGAIPETGTVLVRLGLEASAWLPLRARKHMILIPHNLANLSLAEGLYLSGQGAGMVTWLTGPTRTADIEKVLVLGAQGPEELAVVLYQPEE